MAIARVESKILRSTLCLLLSILNIVQCFMLFSFFRADTFYPDQNTLGVGDHKDSEDAIDNMVIDLEKQ